MTEENKRIDGAYPLLGKRVIVDIGSALYTGVLTEISGTAFCKLTLPWQLVRTYYAEGKSAITAKMVMPCEITLHPVVSCRLCEDPAFIDNLPVFMVGENTTGFPKIGEYVVVDTIGDETYAGVLSHVRPYGTGHACELTTVYKLVRGEGGEFVSRSERIASQLITVILRIEVCTREEREMIEKLPVTKEEEKESERVTNCHDVENV